ncbi:MAG TPA: hypothetical protein PKA53_05370 [Sphingobacterium sp.]|nr:hypothetical protein [Sphingobacterium sp.]
MKRFSIIFLTIILLVVTMDLKGQNTSASVRLDIVLKPILNLTVNPEQQVTTLVYNTTEDYRDGVEVTNKEHLTVFSTGPYVVNVRLADEEYSKLSGETEDSMYLPDVRMSAVPVAEGGQMRLATQTLTTIERELIADDQPALNKVFDVSLHGPGADAFADYVADQTSASFRNTILYSLEIR